MYIKNEDTIYAPATIPGTGAISVIRVSGPDALGIADKRNTRIDHMSYGQQQRVALIRALCQPFEFLLLDEPISHLDDRNSDIMRDIILTEVERQGAALIATSIGKHMNIEYDKSLSL